MQWRKRKRQRNASFLDTTKPTAGAQRTGEPPTEIPPSVSQRQLNVLSTKEFGHGSFGKGEVLRNPPTEEIFVWRFRQHSSCPPIFPRDTPIWHTLTQKSIEACNKNSSGWVTAWQKGGWQLPGRRWEKEETCSRTPAHKDTEALAMKELYLQLSVRRLRRRPGKGHAHKSRAAAPRATHDCHRNTFPA